MPYLRQVDRRLIEYFHCPHCGNDSLEEVCTALQYTTIGGFYDGHVDYIDTETEGLEVQRYQCYECGHTIADGHHGYELYDYLKRKGWLKPHHGIPTSDWEL